MALPRWLGRMNRVGLNHVTRRVAGWAPGFGIVEHEGRRSGRHYRTPVNLFPRDGGFVVALTYGPDADWARNVLHAGRADIRTRRHTRAVTNPRVVHDPERQAIPSMSVRTILRLLDVDHFLFVDEADSTTATDAPDAAEPGAAADAHATDPGDPGEVTGI